MTNISDYIKWRGDITFEEREINEVDNLIFSYLVYVVLDDIVPGIQSDKKITLKEASDIFWAGHTEEEVLCDRNFTRESAFIMKEMAESRRYSNVLLSRYESHTDEHIVEQFCAMSIEIAPGKTYIAYRGTDNSLIGWKEDFNMSFEVIPAQKNALDYLNYVGSMTLGKLWIGGHSKGGNLAIYASVNCSNVIKDKIVAVYNNDGPGFSKSMTEKDEYIQIKNKLFTFVPQSSIVGMLLEHEEDYMVVKSTSVGLLQHDPLTWEVLGTRFIYSDRIDERSVLFDKTTRTWVESMSADERRDFVDELFKAFEQNEIRTLNDFNDNNWKTILESAGSVFRTRTSRGIFKSATKVLKEEAARTFSHTFRKKITNSEKND